MKIFFADYSSCTVEKLYDVLKTSSAGLSQAEALQRLKYSGKNEIKQSDVTWFTIVKNQFFNPFVWILLTISVVYVGTGQYAESFVLFLLVFINVSIGFYQEYHSNKAMELLQTYLQSMVTVIRDGAKVIISTTQLVPGDVIVLYAGDVIPADCRFIGVEDISVDESVLTGESLPVKKTNKIVEKENLAVYEASNIGFSGTVVMEGEGISVVFATGENTSLGAIAVLTIKTMSKSNLAQGTMQLARTLLLLTLSSLIVIVAITIFLRWGHLSFFNLFMFVAALAVSTVPSALPVVITFCLSQGAARLKAHKVIVKRLSSIEDLGGIEVLCTDKTGTLTENSLQVASIYAKDETKTVLQALLSSTFLMTKQKHIPKGFDLALLQKMTEEQKTLVKEYAIVKELPFSYEKGRCISLVRKNNECTLITKGMIEFVLDHCVGINHEDEVHIRQWVDQEELQGNRVIAVASKKMTACIDESSDKEDHSYEFTGLIAFHDPLKKTAEQALKKAQSLGVAIKILSGDSKNVCYAIARQLGLEHDSNNIVLGVDFEKSSDEQKITLLRNHTIFARVTPVQKYHIIECLQKYYSVGYVGDGINDAPALKMAHVSIAVTDAVPVAREAADILLIEKSLLNIVAGIEEGRKIVINTVKYIKVTVSSNFGNFYTLAFSSLLIDYLPMLPLQLVFLNLLTDFPMIALSTDSVSNQELQKPLRYDIKDISFVALLFGVISSPFDFIIFMLFKSTPARLQTNWFMSSSFSQLALIFSLRTKVFFALAKRPSLSLIILCLMAVFVTLVLPYSTFGHRIFSFVSPMAGDLGKICGVVLLYFTVTEITKLIYYKWLNHSSVR